MPKAEVDAIIRNIELGKVASWEELHEFYQDQGQKYSTQKLRHAIGAYNEVFEERITIEVFSDMLDKAVSTKEWMTEGIYNSRAKDYSSEYRKMVYDNKEEMDAVIGKLEDNSFISQQRKALEDYKSEIEAIKKEPGSKSTLEKLSQEKIPV